MIVGRLTRKKMTKWFDNPSPPPPPKNEKWFVIIVNHTKLVLQKNTQSMPVA